MCPCRTVDLCRKHPMCCASHRDRGCERVSYPEPTSSLTVRISRKELTALQAKARSHDAYLVACKTMAAKQYARFEDRHQTDIPELRQYAMGWLDCLSEFSQAVADAGIE